MTKNLNRKYKKLPSKSKFIKRIVLSFSFTMLFLAFSIFIGMLGYHFFEDLPWLDSLLNASMILTGMGPVNKVITDAGKYFASFYAIYSGVAFLTSIAVMLAPIFHRFLHKFHLDVEE